MKHILSLLVLSLVCNICLAQEIGHLKFKGIPIDGTLNSFVQKLKNKGYTYLGTEDGVAVLKGEFAATKGCTIGVSRFSHRDQVKIVAVKFPEHETWSTLYGSYQKYKEFLTEKYGEPLCVEEFRNNVYDDWSMFYAVLHDECNYVSEFSAENGRIELTMKGGEYHKAFVVIRYVDDANAEETRKQIMDDL